MFASVLGSLFTLFVLNLRDGIAIYGTWPQALAAASPIQQDLHESLTSRLKTVVPIPLTKSNTCIIHPQKPLIRNGAWQVFTEGKYEISVYGVYYDDRRGVEPVPVVRVFGVSSAPKNKTVFCQVWYKNNKRNPVLTTAVIASPGRGYKNKQKVQYKEYLYSCPVSKGDFLPVTISLAFRPCQNSTINAPILYVKKEVPKIQFGVCVAAAFGNLDHSRIVEWTEMLKILGVGEINIYNSNVSVKTMELFQHYRNKGLMVIRQCPPPIPENSYWPRKLAVIAGFNDCVYRNMYRYNYTMIIDFDEIIIPKLSTSYTAMINGLRGFHKKLKKDPGLIVFRNAYFFLDLGKSNMTTNNSKSYMNSTILSYTRRVAVSPAGYSVKSIFDPRTCVIGWNHYCIGRLPKTHILNVDPKYALSQHYKKCHFKKAECKKMMNTSVTDVSAMKFKDELLRRISEVHIR